jgi:hypothetical protein
MSGYIAHSVGIRAMSVRGPQNSAHKYGKEEKEYAYSVRHKNLLMYENTKGAIEVAWICRERSYDTIWVGQFDPLSKSERATA